MTTGGLMETAEVARYFGVTAGTLANWRSTGFRRVPYLKIGKAVRYRKQDLDNFIEANIRDQVGPANTSATK